MSLQYTASLYSCCWAGPVSCQRMSSFELLFNFPITAPLRNVCINIFFLQTKVVANAAQQPFSTSFTKTSLWFLTGLAAFEHKLTRPLFPGDINPTVVVSSRLSGMWKPLLSFQRRAGAHPETAALPCVCVRQRKRMYMNYISVYLTPFILLHMLSLSTSSVPAVAFHRCKNRLFHSVLSWVQQCLPATGHLGSGIPWRDGTGCCHVTGKKRQSHHMPKLLPSLYLCYGTPCKQQIPSNPLINYHVLTLI